MNHNSASFSSPVLTAVLLYEPPLVPVVLFPVFPVSPSGVAFSFFGLPVGEGVGVEAGFEVGSGVGVLLGVDVGSGVGVLPGVDVGTGVGVLVGLDVGTGVGVLVGLDVGTGVGVLVGADVTDGGSEVEAAGLSFSFTNTALARSDRVIRPKVPVSVVT